MSGSYDFVIIGGGQAGIPLAHRLAAAGRRVALAEAARLGGSCVNFGCTPTKAVIASAKLAHQARRAYEWGIRIGQIEVDFPAVLARARQITLESRSGLEKGLSGENPKWLHGEARLTGRANDAFQLTVGNEQVTASQVVLNTGTRTATPSIAGLDASRCLTSENWLDQAQLPPRLVIIGSGTIGIEMGQFYRRMGSEVTIVDHSSQILHTEDPDVADLCRSCLEAEGIRFHLGARIQRVEMTSRLEVTMEQDGAQHRLIASHLFLATGRKPNTDRLGLETVGVTVHPDGIVAVDEHLRTSVPGIWAAGDIRGGPMFTHTSWDDYRVIASQLLGDGRHTTRRVVPYAIFSDPEIGRVGLTEREAGEQGIACRKSVFPMKRNGKAREIGEVAGFIKLLVAADSDRILGASLICADAGELVHLFIDLMNADAPFTVMRDAVHIHPTLAEAVQSAAAGL